MAWREEKPCQTWTVPYLPLDPKDVGRRYETDVIRITKMVDQFIIRNHFETETGIAIQGILHPGGITMIKCAGECLDEYFVSTGQLIENTNYINACRTQARIKLDKPVDYFMRNPLGNHHIILMGDHEKVIHEFMQLNSCKLVE